MDKVLKPCPDAPEYPNTTCSYHSVMGKLNFLAQAHAPTSPVPSTHVLATSTIPIPYTNKQSNALVITSTAVPTTKGLFFCPASIVLMLTLIVSSPAHGLKPPLTFVTLPFPGFVITYSGCPIHCVSKLDSEITLSTCKAEYTMCACTLLPLCCILDELTTWFLQLNHAPGFTNAAAT